LIGINFSGDYAADDVAHALRATHPGIDRVLSYMEEKGVGFEVAIVPDDAIEWIVVNRPELVKTPSMPV